MLKEIPNVRQIKGEPRRRWFADDYFDLIVWLDEGDEISGFQLCYDKYGHERALTWFRESGYRHHRVDSGERTLDMLQKATPALVSDGNFDHKEIATLFKLESEEIEDDISSFVFEKLAQY